MAIKKKDSGGGGANWMDTYGDMVTLLLCFFVLLYSMSSISEDNWKAIVMSFNPNASQTITDPELGGEGPSADADEGGVMPEPEKTQEDIDDDIEALFKSLSAYVQEEELQNSLAVTKENGKVYISFNQAVFFSGDSAVLRQESYPILDAVTGMLGEVAGSIDEIRVLGHTAQASTARPNTVRTDRTLASNRATNVVIYIQEHSVNILDPARLVSEGIGQWRPVAPNDTEENRAKNRRVEMVVSGRNLEEELANGVQSYYTTGNVVAEYSTQ